MAWGPTNGTLQTEQTFYYYCEITFFFVGTGGGGRKKLWNTGKKKRTGFAESQSFTRTYVPYRIVGPFRLHRLVPPNLWSQRYLPLALVLPAKATTSVLGFCVKSKQQPWTIILLVYVGSIVDLIGLNKIQMIKEAETDTTQNYGLKVTIFRLAKPAFFRYNENLHWDTRLYS